MDSDYAPAVADDEEEDKDSPYPPATPVVPAAPLPAPVMAPDLSGPMPSAAMSPTPPALGITPGPQPAAPRRPRPEDYQPAELHGIKRGLGVLATGMAAMSPHDPQAGARVSQELFQEPKERAAQAYQAASGSYDTELQQGISERKEAADERHKGAADTQYDRVPVTLSNGTTYLLPQKDAEKMMAADQGNVTKAADTKATNESHEGIAADKNTSAEGIAAGKTASSEKIATGRNRSQEQIAKDRTESAERIAKGHDLTSTENARLRAESANDPDKLTNTMKTMKQQAAATLPKIGEAMDETEEVANLLGPGEGRWNNLMTSTVGSGNPKYEHYKDNIEMVTSAVTLAHARGRMSKELYDHFINMFDAGKKTPENMIQALTVAQDWLGDYAKMGDKPVTAAAPGAKKTGNGNTPLKNERPAKTGKDFAAKIRARQAAAGGGQ